MVAWADSASTPACAGSASTRSGATWPTRSTPTCGRLVAEGRSGRPSGRRVSMDEAGAALDEHEARRSLGRTVVEVAPVTAPATGTDRVHVAGRRAAQPSAAGPERRGERHRRAGGTIPSLARPPWCVAAASKAAGSTTSARTPTGSPSRSSWPRASDEAELTTFGRILVTKMLAAALANRIELQRWVTRPPGRGRRAHRQPLGHRRACPAPGTSLCPCCWASTRWPGRCCSGRRPTPSRRPPWRGRRRTPASPRRPRSSTG